LIYFATQLLVQQKGGGKGGGGEEKKLIKHRENENKMGIDNKLEQVAGLFEFQLFPLGFGVELKKVSLV